MVSSIHPSLINSHAILQRDSFNYFSKEVVKRFARTAHTDTKSVARALGREGYKAYQV